MYLCVIKWRLNKVSRPSLRYRYSANLIHSMLFFPAVTFQRLQPRHNLSDTSSPPMLRVPGPQPSLSCHFIRLRHSRVLRAFGMKYGSEFCGSPERSPFTQFLLKYYKLRSIEEVPILLLTQYTKYTQPILIHFVVVLL